MDGILVIPREIGTAFNSTADCFNFGLWYNKYIPVIDPFTNGRHGSKHDHEGHVKTYNRIAKDKTLNDLLANKQSSIEEFCASFRSTHTLISIKAALVSPLILGIGETHSTEVGMVFDHNLGIPYIPASSLKGVNRLQYVINEITENKQNYDQMDTINDDTIDYLSEIFGQQDRRGGVIFLDTYPETVPELGIDIMNPHYPKYYKDEDAPTDDQNPIPIEFKIVKPGTVFIFRILVSNLIASKDEAQERIKIALEKALENGIGAKTALGYGRFVESKNKPTQTMANMMKQNQKPQDINALFPIGSKGHFLDITQVDEGSIRVTPVEKQDINCVIGKKHIPGAKQNSLKKLFKVGKRIRGEVIGHDKKGNPKFKVDQN